MTNSQDIARDQAHSIYDSDLHHLHLRGDEPQGANPWPGIAAICGALAFAILIIFSVGGCSSPSAQVEAEAVAADVQDAQTAAMQAAIDKRCASVRVHEQLACAVDALAELQPDRWTPEDWEEADSLVEVKPSRRSTQ